VIFSGIGPIVFFMGRKGKLEREVCGIRNSLIRSFEQVLLRQSNLNSLDINVNEREEKHVL
jgi:hypothetical protein